MSDTNAATGNGLAAGTATPQRFDFRRPDRFPREHVRSLATAHEAFARRLGRALAGEVRAIVQVEPASADQMTFDDYVRAMPHPTVVGTIAAPPLPTPVTIEIDAPLVLRIVDRLLGGRADLPADVGAGLRRPTDLEAALLHGVLGHVASALPVALEQVADIDAELTGIEFNPQLVQVTAPADTVLLLAFRISVAGGVRTDGLLTICYPGATAALLIERITALGGERGPDRDEPAADGDLAALRTHLERVSVALAVRLRDTPVAAHDLAALRVGDVLRLEHRTDDPVHINVAGVPTLTGHLGRRGRRLAVQVEQWLRAVPDQPSPPAQP